MSAQVHAADGDGPRGDGNLEGVAKERRSSLSHRLSVIVPESLSDVRRSVYVGLFVNFVLVALGVAIVVVNKHVSEVDASKHPCLGPWQTSREREDA